MPDIDAMEVVERFFAVGTKVVGTAHPVAIFLAGCRECLAEWEVQNAKGRPLPSWRTRAAPNGSGSVGVCPRGQNGHGAGAGP
jgi:hypothetical protein